VTDVGMVGPYDSSLWVKKEIAIHNYKYPYKKTFKIEKSGQKIFNSIILEIKNNKCLSISRFDKVID
jgi:calcineurin-like phosphoesterase